MLRPPLFADDNGDLLVFETAEYLESYLEPENIDDPTMRIYDCEGRLLKLVQLPPESSFARVFGLPGRRIGLVRVDQDPIRPDELHQKLVKFLGREAVIPEGQLQSEPLSRLVELSMPFVTK
jgi:hypothetical protein